MNILTFFMILMFMIYYQDIKKNTEELIIDLLTIILLPIRLIKYIIWLFKKLIHR